MSPRSRKKREGCADKRYFGGVIYYMYDAHKKKTIAKIQAQKLRIEGWLARVVFCDERWVVYRRKK